MSAGTATDLDHSFALDRHLPDALLGQRVRLWDGHEVPPGYGHRGILYRGAVVAEYYTSQPAATQWVAVAVTTVVVADGRSQGHGLVVGIGRTEDGAVDDLEQRLSAGATPPPRADPASRPASV
jgi:hypothetical protein